MAGVQVAAKSMSFLVGEQASAQSAVPPAFYSKRFQDAMRRTFV